MYRFMVYRLDDGFTHSNWPHYISALSLQLNDHKGHDILYLCTIKKQGILHTLIHTRI